jgi:hypothetical protein
VKLLEIKTGRGDNSIVGGLSVLAGRNFAERFSSVLLLICLPVVSYYVIMNTDPRSSRPFQELFSIFLAAVPGTTDWDYHPVSWACKGFVFGLFGRFMLSPLAWWLYTGRW